MSWSSRIGIDASDTGAIAETILRKLTGISGLQKENKSSGKLSHGRRQNESMTGYNLQDQKDTVFKTAKPWRWWLSSFTSHP